MSVSILIGDCREKLRELPEASVDSVVCDPPYHLTSIVKRFGAANAAPAKVGKTGAYARASKGFMGQTWDGGDVAFDPETWAEVLRVLKPGGHLVAFSGTRTYHRMVCAIEDAGFEIRDQLAWVYGSGFPKSLDVSKAIDKRGGNAHLTAEIGAALKAAREARGLSKAEVDARYCGGVTLWSWYEGRPAGQQLPTAEIMAKIAADWPELSEYAAAIAEAERETIGLRAGSKLAVAPGQSNDRSGLTLGITASSTAEAQQWQGWGTALKPSWEPICLARKPLDGTVAGNVLKHGTGALNIDGCRIGMSDEDADFIRKTARPNTAGLAHEGSVMNRPGSPTVNVHPQGRWPANLCHDGSDEVLAGFPETHSAGFATNGTPNGGRAFEASSYAHGGTGGRIGDEGGSAARFFYCAKATTEERGEGNNHPTVKPVALMRWLVRLVTPKGGTVLDPFLGSGSTGLAADAEQFNFIGCELSADYAAIAERRIRDAAGMFADVKVAA